MRPVLLLFFASIAQFVAAQYGVFPNANKETVIDTFFNTAVLDDYRWLESTHTPACIDWLESQSKFAKEELRKTSTKINSYTAIDRLAYVRCENPRKEGDCYFTYAFYNNVSAPALYVKNSLRDNAQLLVDPNFISTKDNINLRQYNASSDSKYLAYLFSRNGSDWGEIKVVNIRTGNHLDDHLKRVKFSSIAWRGNGFYYSVFPEHEFEESKGQEVYYHELNTDQSADKLIFRRTSNPRAFFDVSTTSDERFMLLREVDEEKAMVNIFYIDFQSATPSLLPLLTRLTPNEDVEILDNHGDDLIARTYKDVNNGMIVSFNVANPRQWKVLVPEYSSALLQEVKVLENKIIAIYQSDGKQQVDFFDFSGKLLGAIKLPFGISVNGLNGERTDKQLLMSYEGYTQPKVVYVLDTETLETKPLSATVVNFDYTQFETKELNYTSFDGTVVPMCFVYKKGTELRANNPTILKAYGGFGVVDSPNFDAGIVHFLNEGGLFVFANIRGGGDKGKEWAEQGSGANKPNSFKDFISAAEFLIAEGYTSPQKLAITGASNGGLVVGVAMTQRPDLFRVAVPVVAPFDMIRFGNFTIGHLHSDEYGNVNNKTGFENLFEYSPLHNVKEDVNYPATLIMTSEFDDRVPPFHAYKFAAKLQNRAAQQNAVLLRVEKGAGHYGANSSLSSALREAADVYDFILYHLKRNS